MKKIIYTLFALLFAQCVMAKKISSASSYTFKQVSPGYVEVTGLSDAEKNSLAKGDILDIPNFDKNSQHVIGVAANAFKDLTQIDSVMFSMDCKYIGANAFAGCTGIKNISLPNCGSIVLVDKGDSYLNYSAFSGCTNLKGVLPNKDLVEKYYGNSDMNLRDVFPYATAFYIDNTVSKIGECTFLRRNKTYASVVSILPRFNVEMPKLEIGRFAFCGNETITIGHLKVKSVGSWAFSIKSGETAKPKVYIDLSEAETIEANAFKECSKIYSTTSGEEDVFHLENCVSIGETAFGNNNDIVLYLNTKNIAADAFHNSYIGELHIVSQELADNSYTSDNNLAKMFPRVKDVYLDVDKVGDYAFYGWNTLFDRKLYLNVSTVGNYAFAGNSGTYPRYSEIHADGVTALGNYAFAEASVYGEPSFPKVTTVGNGCFSKNTLRHISLPLVTSIPADAFAGAFVESVYAPNVASIGDRAFMGCDGFDGKKTETTLYAFPKLSVLGTSAFENCISLTDAVFEGSNGLTTIGGRAFYKCGNIEMADRYVAANTQSIGDSAFCKTNVKNVVLGKNVKSLGLGAFENLQNLTVASYHLLYNNKNLFNSVALVNDGTATLTVGGVDESTPIGQNKFYTADQLNLRRITINNGVSQMANHSFYNLAADSIVIGENADFFCDVTGNKMLCNKHLTVNSPKIFVSNASGKEFGLSKTLFTIFGNRFKSMEGTLVGENLKCGAYAFFSKTSSALEKVNVSGWEAVDDRAFAGNKNLVSFSGMANISYIGDYAFYECNLGSYVSPTSGVLEIGKQAFYHNPIKVITISTEEGLTDIQADAFEGVKPRLVYDESNRLALSGAETDAKMITATEVKAKSLRGSLFTYSISSERMNHDAEDVDMSGGLSGDDAQRIYNAMK